MLSKIKPYTDRYLQKLMRGLPRFSPNVITVTGLLPAVLFTYFLVNGHLAWAIICCIGSLFDLLDGAYARATGQVTAFGSLLDSTFDRISDAIIISAFGFSGLVPWPTALALLVASFLISYTRASGSNLIADKTALAVGPIERGERLTLIFVGLLAHYILVLQKIRFDILTPLFLTLTLLSVVTIIRRLYAVKEKTRLP
jgi:archaetidylinositol phosphate synthase